MARRDKVAPSREPAVDLAVARRFGTLLRRWFRANGRDLPWRKTRDPYHILVSELMLQQTQVVRVVDFYHRFLDRFPTLDRLASATPRDRARTRS
jgi:A/G-specific adenine glycosylase